MRIKESSLPEVKYYTSLPTFRGSLRRINKWNWENGYRIHVVFPDSMSAQFFDDAAKERGWLYIEESNSEKEKNNIFDRIKKMLVKR